MLPHSHAQIPAGERKIIVGGTFEHGEGSADVPDRLFHQRLASRARTYN
jgi:hypothetical protein